MCAHRPPARHPPIHSQRNRRSVRAVLTSDDLLGGPSTFLILFGSEKFAESNPKTMRAVLSAMEQAMAYINEHRRLAAELYLKVEKSPMTVEFVEQILADPASEFVIEPTRIMKYAEFMGRTGALRQTPKAWKELFLPLIADRNGS
jgi:NitT/TauT family transport system substrate-binding protein